MARETIITSLNKDLSGQTYHWFDQKNGRQITWTADKKLAETIVNSLRQGREIKVITDDPNQVAESRILFLAQRW